MTASRVLVIDDSTTLRKLVEIAMRGTGVDIDFAATGSDGVSRARSARPDVILLDYLLPDLESTEVVQLLSDDTSTAKVPVVVMSANQAHVFESFKRFPAVVDFVGKPFSPSEIRARLETAIKGGPTPEPSPAMPIARVRPRTRQSLAPATHPELQLAGSLYTTPLLDVLRLLASSSATGTLVVDVQRLYRIYVRRGDVVMCTASADGKPALLAQAQAGTTRVAELPAALHRESAKLLDEMLGASTGRFTWQAQLGLPDYVEAFGRTLSLTSIALARQRRAAPTSSASARFLDEIYDRTPGFSEKLAGSRLEPDEKRLLGLVDGRTTVREILARAEISSDRAAAVLARLENVDLIRKDTSSVVEAGGGVVTIFDDDPAFIAAVRAHLGAREASIDVVAVEDSARVASVALEQRARMILINAKFCTPDLIKREISVIASSGTMEIVAVLDAPDREQVDALIQMGMHASLIKPVHVNDLERLLSLP